eukprot:1157654-Pelagomonas_calceolata.AAC.5
MQPRAPKGQGFLFSLLEEPTGSVEGAGQPPREACMGGIHSFQGDPEAQVKGTRELAAAVAHSQEEQGAWVGRLREPMEVSEGTTDETMEGG